MLSLNLKLLSISKPLGRYKSWVIHLACMLELLSDPSSLQKSKPNFYLVVLKRQKTSLDHCICSLQVNKKKEKCFCVHTRETQTQYIKDSLKGMRRTSTSLKYGKLFYRKKKKRLGVGRWERITPRSQYKSHRKILEFLRVFYNCY